MKRTRLIFYWSEIELQIEYKKVIEVTFL